MYCPYCNASVTDGDAFCPSCGAQVTQQQPAAQQTQPMPQVQQQYQQQPAAYGQQGAYPQQPAYGQTGQMPQQPPKSKTGLIIAVVAIGFVLLLCVSVGGFFAWRSYANRNNSNTTTTTPTTPPTTVPSTVPTSTTTPPTGTDTEQPPTDNGTPPSAASFATPEEALYDVLEDGWVYDIFAGDDVMLRYIIGPPASEYTDLVTIDKQADGSWMVTDISAWAPGDSGEDTGSTAGAEAEEVLGDFLLDILEDRPEEAHAMTISPFSEDAASAQYANGEFEYFEFLETTVNEDQTVDILTSEVWSYGTEEWIYQLAPTELGYRIYNLKFPGE